MKKIMDCRDFEDKLVLYTIAYNEGEITETMMDQKIYDLIKENRKTYRLYKKSHSVAGIKKSIRRHKERHPSLIHVLLCAFVCEDVPEEYGVNFNYKS